MISQPVSTSRVRYAGPTRENPGQQGPTAILDRFEKEGGQLFHATGYFLPKYTPVDSQKAVEYLQDNRKGNLVALAPGETEKFALDTRQDLNDLQVIYLGAHPELSQDPMAALAVHNLRQAGYLFLHGDAPVAAKTAYDQFAHDIFNGQYIEVAGPAGKEVHYHARDIGIMDYFQLRHDERTLERPDVARMVESWEQDGLSHWLADPRRRYEDFVAGRTDQFRLHGIQLSQSRIPSDSEDLRQAHERAVQRVPFIENTFGEQIRAGRLDTETTQRIYDRVINTPVGVTTEEQRWLAYADLNRSLIEAQGCPVEGWFVVELNRAALDFYTTLASIAPADKFLAGLSKAARTLDDLPGFTPARVVEAAISAAGPELDQLTEKQQCELLAKLNQSLEQLVRFRPQGSNQ